MGVVSILIALRFFWTAHVLTQQLVKLNAYNARLVKLTVVFTVGWIGGGLVWFLSVWDAAMFARHFTAFSVLFFTLDLVSVYTVVLMYRDKSAFIVRCYGPRHPPTCRGRVEEGPRCAGRGARRPRGLGLSQL